jgi:two-component system chemotaxis response regulator CheB
MALERILGGLPEDFPAAVAIAQHRSAESGSGALGALLGRHSALEVSEAMDKDEIEAGHVYVAPADYHLIVEPGMFALSVDEAVQFSRPSIDVMFDTAADSYAERLVGVVLTGANEDGAYGISRVKRRGGVTIVQDPETAAKRAMPDAAIATGAVDHVVPLDDIAELLTDLVPEREARGRVA